MKILLKGYEPAKITNLALFSEQERSLIKKAKTCNNGSAKMSSSRASSQKLQLTQFCQIFCFDITE